MKLIQQCVALGYSVSDLPILFYITVKQLYTLDQNQAHKLKQLKLLGQVFDVKSIFKYASMSWCLVSQVGLKFLVLLHDLKD